MKVLITTDWYKPAVNGVVTSVLSLADGLSKLGHEVRILTLSCSRHSYTEGNVTYIGSIGVGKIYPEARLKLASASPCIHDLLEWGPDIIHSQCEFSTFYVARRIALLADCPLIHTYHTLYEDYTDYVLRPARFGKFMATAFTRAVLKRTDEVIVPTMKIRRILARYGVHTPVEVIPTGLELDRYREPLSGAERAARREALGLAPSDRVLVYLGRLAKEKNIDELLRLLAAEEDDGLRLLLVGDGPYRQKLEELAGELCLGNRVIFCGMVRPEEVAGWYGLGDAFVSCSRSETQGLTYIEALAAGLPLLCQEDPCLRGVVRPGVTGFTFDGPKAFHEQLRALLSDEPGRKRMAAAARRAAFEEFSSLGFARRVEEAYQRVLRRRRAARAA